jgi:hypothetical protein
LGRRQTAEIPYLLFDRIDASQHYVARLAVWLLGDRPVIPQRKSIEKIPQVGVPFCFPGVLPGRRDEIE